MECLVISEGQSTEDKQEQKHELQGGKRDAMKTHYKTFTKTTLPHVLTEYGLEDKEHIEKKVSSCLRRMKSISKADHSGPSCSKLMT